MKRETLLKECLPEGGYSTKGRGDEGCILMLKHAYPGGNPVVILP